MDSDDEMDKGRTKKVKKYKEERHWDHNPFQVNEKDNLIFIELSPAGQTKIFRGTVQECTLSLVY
jgi:hypothetical protein